VCMRGKEDGPKQVHTDCIDNRADSQVRFSLFLALFAVYSLSLSFLLFCNILFPLGCLSQLFLFLYFLFKAVGEKASVSACV
jgi:hypothetical protein